MHNIDFDTFDVRELIEDNWQTFLDSDEVDWEPAGVREELDPETKRLLNSF